MGYKYDYGFCPDCGQKTRVYHREWLKARQPRCFACGATLQQSQASHKEHVKHEDVARRLEKRKFGRGRVVS
jgi:ribosomal protein S27E